MISKIRGAVAALAAMVVGVLVAPAPAHAAWSDCSAARICIYNGYNGTGSLYQWTLGHIKSQPRGCLNLTGSQNDTTGSFWMNGAIVGTVVRLHGGANCGGAGQVVWYISSNMRDSDFRSGSPIVGFDNSLSSISVVNA